MLAVDAELKRRGVHPARCVVLLPYAQLIAQARAAWAAACSASFFVPQFETTLNWASRLQAAQGGYKPTAQSIRMDMAHDALVAASLLERAGLAAQKAMLTSRLVQAAWSLAHVAAARPPEQRAAWGATVASTLGAGLNTPMLAMEAAVGRIALAWALASSYATDVLFSASVDFLVVLQGLQLDPLTQALQVHWQAARLALPLLQPNPPGHIALHAAQDMEDEAQLAAACVLTHLAKGRQPVALVAQDRTLTRRVLAMLAGQGVLVRDETGWTLSTTRAAAALMGLLRAAPAQASTNAVLDWLKHTPAVDTQQLGALEQALRRVGVRHWQRVPASLVAAHQLFSQVQPWRQALQASRTLSQWLVDVRSTLQTIGQWQGLAGDAAGQAVLQALRLHGENPHEFAYMQEAMTLQDFTLWASQTLESASFRPEPPEQAQVVVLPLNQLLGRSLQAVVLPGADENHLPTMPEPADAWTPAQRQCLGLPSRQQLALDARAAWQHALQFAVVDVLWRTSHGGERCMPSGFVQALLLNPKQALAPEVRPVRTLLAQPTPAPCPSGQALPVGRLSASAYADLRACPYRFFALRQLGLKEPEELEQTLQKRDFGNWLHTVLKDFHKALQQHPTQETPALLAMLDAAAQAAQQTMGWSESEFLPFASSWPKVRDAYLSWLHEHQASGARFVAAEQWQETPLGPWSLVGKLDRIDRLPDGQTYLLDYKTEARDVTAQRLANPQEDTQLAFYAALCAQDDTLFAAYVNISEKEPVKTYEQTDIVALRDDLIASIQNDLGQIAQGTPLLALGEGSACEHCAARGLCRKDFRVNG